MSTKREKELQRKAEEDKKKKEEEEERKKQKKIRKFWKNLNSLESAKERDAESGKLKNGGTEWDPKKDVKMTPSRSWRLERTPQKFRGLLWAVEHVEKDVGVRAKLPEIANKLRIYYEESDEEEEEGSSSPRKTKGKKKKDQNTGKNEDEENGKKKKGKGKESKKSKDDKFYSLVQEYCYRDKENDLGGVVEALESLGLTSAAEKLKGPQFSHLFNDRKPKTVKKEKKEEEDAEGLWDNIYSLPTANERDKAAGGWWPYQNTPRTKTEPVYHNDIMLMKRKFYEEEVLCPIPGGSVTPRDPVEKWKRQTATVSGSRWRRLELTPEKYRTVLWAVEHVTGSKQIHGNLENIGRLLNVKVSTMENILEEDIPNDEKFYQIVDATRKKKLDDVTSALAELRIFDAVRTLTAPRFKHLYKSYKDQWN